MLHDVDGMNELIAPLPGGRPRLLRNANRSISTCASCCARWRPSTATPASRSAATAGPTAACACGRWRCRRILSNLVDNAIRYGAGRPVDIEYAVVGRAGGDLRARPRPRHSRERARGGVPPLPSAGSLRAAAAPAAAGSGWPSCARSPAATAGRSNCGRGRAVARPPACVRAAAGRANGAAWAP